MPNDYYDHTTFPSPNAPGSSAALRAEFDLVEAGFNKLPTLAGNGNKLIVVNSGGTALEATASVPAGIALTNPAITGGTINGTVIGGVTPAAGTFTSLSATSANLSGGTFASPTFTGVPTAPTAVTGTSTTQIATTAFVTAAAFNSALPGQAGNAGKFVTTDGSNASWADVYPSQTSNAGKFLRTNGTTVSWQFATPALVVVSGTTQAAVADAHYVLTNAAATTVTLPATPSAGDVVWITVGNGRVDNVIARNGSNIQSLAEDLTLNAAYAAVQMRYINSTIGWAFV